MLLRNITREAGIVLSPAVGEVCRAEDAFSTKSKSDFILEAFSLTKHSLPANFRQGKVVVDPNLGEGTLASYKGFLHEIHIREDLDSQSVIIHELGHAIDHHLGEYIRYFSDSCSSWKSICEDWIQEDLENGIEIDPNYRHRTRELFARAYVMHIYKGNLCEDVVHSREWYPSNELYETKIRCYLDDLLNFKSTLKVA